MLFIITDSQYSQRTAGPLGTICCNKYVSLDYIGTILVAMLVDRSVAIASEIALRIHVT